MPLLFRIAAVAACSCPVLSAWGQCTSTFTETFAGGTNDGEWGIGFDSGPSNNGQLMPSGGNPGEFIGSQNFFAFSPRAKTELGVASVFHGDYRAAGVIEMGIDLQTFSSTGNWVGTVSLWLSSDPDTPGDVTDDSLVYFLSSLEGPSPGQGWKSYDLAVPSASTTLPVGWLSSSNGTPDEVWNEVIEDVDQVIWIYAFFMDFEQWTVGLDNPRIGFAPPVNYCTAGTSASGCQASLSACGTASGTAASGFTLSATTVEGQKDGLFFFGTNGQQANPWGNGTSYQCVVPPVTRAGTLSGTGTVGLCDGSFAQDLNALWCPSCPKPAKNPGAGATVQAQLWYRDPLSTSNQTTSLSDAIEFVVAQ